MVKLQIIRTDAYNKYLLLNTKTQANLSLILEFYGVNSPTVGDIIAINEKLLDPSYEGFCQPYAFKLCENKVSMPKDDAEYVALKSGKFSYVLKRIYG